MGNLTQIIYHLPNRVIQISIRRDVATGHIQHGTTEYKAHRTVTRVGTFEVCVPTHVALRMFIMQVLASQLHFQANRNAELAIPPLFLPVNCIKIGGYVALLSDPTVYSLYCDGTQIGKELQTGLVIFMNN